MADTMQFDLVSPERRLASVAAREVRIPGADGDLTAMPGHAALITTLRPGILTVVSAEGTADYAVTGGFAEISADAVTVLAERGLPKAEVTSAIMAALVADARAARAAAPHHMVDEAVKLLADMEALGTQIGL
ncbi:F0F1 ATP synthase subunit epsilon [Phaeovulum sp.]|jgi:F-type H+-transporting ATPase subunit epsilon|uniref:F0F1 ATP synthase subunit epsilon n=1 Tax=Phaeovulum sp. TaxID=2934796 RepID=UPI002731040C|nr:F0F1 ATP synthase subunit epsilon [Phaeovulum sp.]MDP1668347.1 F0F1 ATP synthase subunit epsilon [Phaeovulum sp.]MDP2062604.1 F0F1 ATP synthase subunit epsilon [Phaeovulum sp.]MDP3862538.1 F0F1 ATP synthase subunit epsilon [Phaeovulum sp.]MDZ4117938.1 F0F1 ATP synthase subunit epsilon [Phaeovulum sp.]